MKQIKVKVFSNFCTSEICKEKFEKTFKSNLMKNYGIDKKIYITCDDDYSHAIILNTATPTLDIDKKNVIGLACEPFPFLGITPEFVEYAKKYIGKYLIGDKMSFDSPFIEHHGFMWFDHPDPSKIIEKKKLMSIVFSEKIGAPGHKYRHELVNQIIKNNLPIDIYGRGCSALPDEVKSFSNIKGTFTEREPYDDYVFTIAIENFACNHYFSEKIMTPIMCNTIPIYFGCKNIKKYVKDRYIPLSGKLRADVALIKDILQNSHKYIKEIVTAKEEVFNKVNFLKKIEKLF